MNQFSLPLQKIPANLLSLGALWIGLLPQVWLSTAQMKTTWTSAKVMLPSANLWMAVSLAGLNTSTG